MMHSCAHGGNSCTLPSFDKPAFQVPSLGKSTPHVEATLSKQYALLKLLCSLNEQCEHAHICSWKGCGAIVNNVSMHTCEFGNPIHGKKHDNFERLHMSVGLTAIGNTLHTL